MGNRETIHAGHAQRITAGTGITHSEFNPSQTQQVHFYQVWITPQRNGLPPSYEQKMLDLPTQRGEWQLMASRTGRDGSVTVHQDIEIYECAADPEQKMTFELPPDRHAWLQVLQGEAALFDHDLKQGDGVAVSQETLLEITPITQCQLMMFNLM